MRFTVRTVAVSALIAACALVSLAQVKPAKTDQLRMVQMNGVYFPALLAQLAADYDLTFSLEIDPAQPPAPVNVDLRGVNFAQLMDGLIKAEPGYQWRERDGGIEVYPAKASSNFIDTRITRFQVRDVNREAAISNLLATPEVYGQILSRNLKPLPQRPTAKQIQDEKLSIELTDVTVRQALNKIAELSGAKFWLFRSSPDGTFEITTFAAPPAVN